MSTPNRAQQWLDQLAPQASVVPALPASVQARDAVFAGRNARFIAVVPDAQNLFPRARNGEVGMLEGWGLAKAVQETIEQDKNVSEKRVIIAVVDVPSQAYGRREEALGIHQALAGAAGAYAQARLAGHPVLALLVGKAMSGAFLAHGYQANRIVALRDAGVMVHAMGKESAARVTLRTVDELEALAEKIPPMAYDINNYGSLGLLHALVDVTNPAMPTTEDVSKVQQALSEALDSIAQGDVSLSNRLGAANRQASSKVRELMRAQWN
ncbi:biotin-independent malonate decarboxylase subunit gamma [Pseudomonas sp. F1_0610]|uniref:biotin-independent malonate decarboxylase subunit gamma n=1 Tax=Pseudomonas sp. F1_0610 TaxID=3114284 RepID=UPI0039C3781E